MNKTFQYNPLKYPVYVMTKAIGLACNLSVATAIIWIRKVGVVDKSNAQNLFVFFHLFIIVFKLSDGTRT